MKLAFFIIAAVMVYGVSVFHFVHQYVTATDVELKKDYKIGPTLFSVTAFFAAVIIKTVALTMQGVLPLL